MADFGNFWYHSLRLQESKTPKCTAINVGMIYLRKNSYFIRGYIWVIKVKSCCWWYCGCVFVYSDSPFMDGVISFVLVRSSELVNVRRALKEQKIFW